MDAAMQAGPQRRARRWRGRALPRPQEQLVDQGLGFDVQTLVDRRAVLQAIGLAAVGLGLGACATGSSTPGASSDAATSASAAASGEVPEETAGPYPGDGSNGPDVLEQSGIVRSDIRSSFAGAGGVAEGVPMMLLLSVRDLAKAGAALAGAAVYVWHCDREGRYSMYSRGAQDENYLRGVQIADDTGLVRFTSIFPACYSGRWPHIHFEVYPDPASITDASRAIATSQVALPEAACQAVYAVDGYEQSASNLRRVTLARDTVFGDDGGGRQLATVTGSVSAGYTVRLDVGVDPTTPPTGGGAPAGSDGRPRGAPNGARPSS